MFCSPWYKMVKFTWCCHSFPVPSTNLDNPLPPPTFLPQSSLFYSNAISSPALRPVPDRWFPMGAGPSKRPESSPAFLWVNNVVFLSYALFFQVTGCIHIPVAYKPCVMAESCIYVYTPLVYVIQIRCKVCYCMIS